MDPRVTHRFLVAALLAAAAAARLAGQSTADIPMKITTKSFSNTRPIPERFTADGKNVNPPLTISGVPEKTKSLALIVDDPDAPSGTWDHWLVWNIKPATATIDEDSVPHGAVVGRNDFGHAKYEGPSPPAGTHRYFFRLYALDTMLDLPAGAGRSQLEAAMQGHVLARAALLGRYARE